MKLGSPGWFLGDLDIAVQGLGFKFEFLELGLGSVMDSASAVR